MTKKKARMKKAPIIFILLLVIISIIFYFVKSGKVLEVSNYTKLKDKGYLESEIKIINKDEKLVNYALNNSYNKYLTKLYSTDEFIFSKLDTYLNYINDNNTAPINDVVMLVNKDILNSYSDNLINLVKEKYFIINRLDRYLSYLDTYPSLSINEIITNVNCNLDYNYYTNISPSDLTYDKLIIANKYYNLDENYVNPNLVNIESTYSKNGGKLDNEAYNAFKKLSDDAKNDGLSILIQSAYRSYQSQLTIYNNYVNSNGITWTNKWSAKAGHSEHQTGLAIDVLTKNTSSLGEFVNTEEFIWMKENSYKYGFILRYKEDTTDLTGYGYEPWHYRYVGVDAAKKVYDSNITFDEYYAYYVIKK